jgi:hypothetical protein
VISLKIVLSIEKLHFASFFNSHNGVEFGAKTADETMAIMEQGDNAKRFGLRETRKTSGVYESCKLEISDNCASSLIQQWTGA